MPGKCKPYLIAGLLTLWCTVAAAQDVNMFSVIKSGGNFSLDSNGMISGTFSLLDNSAPALFEIEDGQLDGNDPQH